MESFATMFVSVVLGGLAGWVSAHHVQSSMHLRSRKDELKNYFYDYLNLVSSYWLGEGSDLAKRRSMEAQIISLHSIIMADYSILKKADKRIRMSYQSTKENRKNLWHVATGGCFQGAEWEPDGERVRQSASEVVQIVKSLY